MCAYILGYYYPHYSPHSSPYTYPTKCFKKLLTQAIIPSNQVLSNLGTLGHPIPSELFVQGLHCVLDLRRRRLDWRLWRRFGDRGKPPHEAQSRYLNMAGTSPYK